jgi:hypothetical protein
MPRQPLQAKEGFLFAFCHVAPPKCGFGLLDMVGERRVSAEQGKILILGEDGLGQGPEGEPKQNSFPFSHGIHNILC